MTASTRYSVQVLIRTAQDAPAHAPMRVSAKRLRTTGHHGDKVGSGTAARRESKDRSTWRGSMGVPMLVVKTSVWSA